MRCLLHFLATRLLELHALLCVSLRIVYRRTIVSVVCMYVCVCGIHTCKQALVMVCSLEALAAAASVAATAAFTTTLFINSVFQVSRGLIFHPKNANKKRKKKTIIKQNCAVYMAASSSVCVCALYGMLYGICDCYVVCLLLFLYINTLDFSFTLLFGSVDSAVCHRGVWCFVRCRNRASERERDIERETQTMTYTQLRY